MIPMKAKKRQFRGRLDELMELTARAGLDGQWLEKPNGVWSFRYRLGGHLHWSSTKFTLWTDGDAVSRSELEASLAHVGLELG